MAGTGRPESIEDRAFESAQVAATTLRRAKEQASLQDPDIGVRTQSRRSPVACAPEKFPASGPWGSVSGQIHPAPDEDANFATDTVEAASTARSRAGVKRPSLARAVGSMALAGMVSKTTGFARSLVIAWVLGLSVRADAYNAANTMPNQVYELLVGGVLASVMVPVLVRAHTDDADGGETYTQRLLTMATAALALITVVAVAAAPLLTAVVVDTSTGRANSALTTAFAYLLLPQILFYGLSALLIAVLNAKHVFTPPAWAPVLNNAVLLATFGTYSSLPGQLTLDPVRMTDAHLLVLGIGSTLGVVLQAAVLVPPLWHTGFRFKWRWGWDRRFGEFGQLTLWTIGYALVAQVGVLAVTNVATAHGGLAIYDTVWLLIQLPYGVVGLSLITAVLPRMTRAAAENDNIAVASDVSLATRLSTTAILPMSALLTVLGPSLGTALFSVGKGAHNAHHLGVALAVAAFGALPYAITLIQLRAFYAMKDARTPTLIMAVSMGVKVVLSSLAPVLLPAQDVVYGLTFANSLSFVVGWLTGEFWLRSRLGTTGGPRRRTTLGKSLLASVAAAVVALPVHWALPHGVTGAWLSVGIGGLAGMATAAGVLLLVRTQELQPIMRRIAYSNHVSAQPRTLR